MKNSNIIFVFRAEPRNSIAYGRMSLAPRSSLAAGSLTGRPSTLVVAGAGSKKVLTIPRQSTLKDSRQASDRNRLNDMINRMMDFFSAKEAPFSHNERMIRAPSKNDFKTMFEFMFRELDDSYSVQKIEDEVIFIFFIRLLFNSLFRFLKFLQPWVILYL